MGKTYITVENLNKIVGNMTNAKVSIKVYKKLSYNISDMTFSSTLYSNDVVDYFAKYFVFNIQSVSIDGYGYIKLSVCLERPGGDWKEVIL